MVVNDNCPRKLFYRELCERFVEFLNKREFDGKKVKKPKPRSEAAENRAKAWKAEKNKQ